MPVLFSIPRPLYEIVTPFIDIVHRSEIQYPLVSMLCTTGVEAQPIKSVFPDPKGAAIPLS